MFLIVSPYSRIAPIYDLPSAFLFFSVSALLSRSSRGSMTFDFARQPISAAERDCLPAI